MPKPCRYCNQAIEFKVVNIDGSDHYCPQKFSANSNGQFAPNDARATMPYGQYKGRLIVDIARHDPGYLRHEYARILKPTLREQVSWALQSVTGQAPPQPPRQYAIPWPEPDWPDAPAHVEVNVTPVEPGNEEW